ncbi:sigma-54 interaction domain-containing protein [Acetobacterium bakii]|uniref:sigma-54 interaction domain-containing protein n=1 Tax=Acetobacterium bakii TaxID=52689 RepID=UPI000681FEDB|nr:sigma 54-interacting transcriptional regulator [Acetobacterium bakii]
MINFPHNDEYDQYLNAIDDNYFKRVLDHLGLPIFVIKSDNQLIYSNPEGSICLQKFGLKELMVFFNMGILQAKECLHTIIYQHDKPLDEGFSSSIVTPIITCKKNKSPAYYIIIIQRVIKNFDGDAQIKKPHLRVKNKKNRDIIGRSHEFLYPLIQLERISRYDIAILLLGESGTGKTMIAEYIHNRSNRCNAAFMSINCGAIPAELLESELFGYAPGAFTGANHKGKNGLFQRADGGTIFLDEIGDMPLDLQVKLLHVLENSTFVPIGGNEPIKVNVRIISATNKNLLECIKEQTFRNDLYWRINSFIETIPPLRERKSDIVILALFFLKDYNLKNNTNKLFHPLTLEALSHYQWPGNVRELKNVVKRMCVLTEGPIIYENIIPMEIREEIDEPIESSFSFDDLIDQVKAVVIQSACKKNKTSAAVARELGISQPTAYRLIKTYGPYNCFT